MSERISAALHRIDKGERKTAVDVVRNRLCTGWEIVVMQGDSLE
jgi:hypothetical protein